jgi:hypothetical protein
MSPHRAIGIFGGIGLIRRYVEAGKQADRLIEVKVIDMTATFLVQELEGQHGSSGRAIIYSPD